MLAPAINNICDNLLENYKKNPSDELNLVIWHICRKFYMHAIDVSQSQENGASLKENSARQILKIHQVMTPKHQKGKPHLYAAMAYLALQSPQDAVHELEFFIEDPTFVPELVPSVHFWAA